MFVHHKGATLIPNARRESVPAFQSHAIVHTQHLPCHSPVPWLHRLSFTHHHPTFSAKISFLRARKRDPPHGSGRIGGLGLPGRASLAPGATCPKIQLPCLVTGSGRASPGLSLVTQNKQSLLTGREVRDAKRRRPIYLKGSSSCVARYPPKAGTGLAHHALPWTCDRFPTDPLGLSRIGRYPGALWEVV